ncbi:MAG: multicopper oxidase family protein [Deltaproteobacteria bacterium]|nr:multicopper oxidase family protein [Deltaproteobacteria bacterium]
MRAGALLLLLALLASACRPSPPVDPAVAEFGDAYPAEVSERGGVRRYDLVAAPAILPMLDGRRLAVWAYDGQVPGPILHATVGERVRIHFTNRLSEATTVHWHGVRVPHAMDGVPGLTQPPVEPGASFDYEFVPKDAGTFWFHPHLRSPEQVERGLFGVFVVHEVDPPSFSQDVVWVLDDWRLGGDGAIDPAFVTRHDLMHDGRWGNVVTVNGRVNETLVVRPGERIRLRLLNTANGRVFRPDFSGLDARVIAVDGMTTPRPVDPAGFELAPGNRLDLDLTIPADAAGRQFRIVDGFVQGRPNSLGWIRIEGDPVPTPSFPSPARAHVPAWKAVPNEPTLQFELQAQRGGPYGVAWTLNGEAATDHAHHPGSALVLGRFARLRFVNASFRLHPMHTHGMFFKVLARNGAPVDEPWWRDTVLVHAKETVDVGLVPLDAGRWMMHCHVLEHAEAGMMTTLDVAPPSPG